MCTVSLSYVLFFFNDTATTEIYTLSLHDALPIFVIHRSCRSGGVLAGGGRCWIRDRKSKRLNSSHGSISYAVFCLQQKKKEQILLARRRLDETPMHTVRARVVLHV